MHSAFGASNVYESDARGGRPWIYMFGAWVMAVFIDMLKSSQHKKGLS